MVYVDDQLPFSKSSNSLIFARPGSDGSLWAVLLEKVWAKVNGNYDLINGGLANDAYDFILGAPTMYY